MRTTALRYFETAAITAAICLPLHYFTGMNWPRALAVGLGCRNCRARDRQSQAQSKQPRRVT
jgi:hypothetical protein